MKKFILKIAKANLFVLIIVLFSSCTTSSIFTSIGDNISAPNGMAVDSDNNRLYLINSNSTVLYKWDEGSIQVLDITNPAAPSLLNTAQTISFGGQVILDSTTKLLYTTSRYSTDSADNEDQMLRMNYDEGSTEYLNVAPAATRKNPYGIACCYPDDRMWIATEDNALQYIDKTSMSGGTINLKQPLSTGSLQNHAEVSYIVLNDTLAYVPRIKNGLLIVNLDEADDASKNAVDYFISDITTPEGIAFDGTYTYVIGYEEIDSKWKSMLFILDLSTLVPVFDNETTQVLDKNDSSILVAQIEVGATPQNVLIDNNYAFVTCSRDDRVDVIDIAARTVIANITVQDEPFGMAMRYDAGGTATHLYVGNVSSNTISIIDIPGFTVVGTYPQ
ncbi:MAG: hypothetical protein COS89_07935 [Deltaproteobacteria bacterium CG07_land_8_20_14_0_80_38_7]|nr:MAG: hypothetical protein COS89_07935 [Deltaproteobacteria bacterium CG07_land_8_20_14_0_80_38_7]